MNVFIIEQAWADSLENHSSSAFGYKPIGFVESQKEAESIVENGGDAPYCWATPRGATMFRYVEVPDFYERELT